MRPAMTEQRSPDAPRATVGVIGGSGLYSFLHDAEEVEVDTPWGSPSDMVTVASLEGRSVAFLPRHARRHTIPPHRINYRANLWALHSLGVERVIAPCAVGSLRVEHRPGSIVVLDQYVDRTSGRRDTFFDGREVVHLSAAHPYCRELIPLATGAGRAAGLATHEGGTVCVVNGPRFGTLAESRFHAAMGWDVVNMTQYPEVTLARELGMCYVALALVTDYDSGLEDDPDIPPVTSEEVFAVFRRTTDTLRDALRRLIAALPDRRTCDCGPAPTAVH